MTTRDETEYELDVGNPQIAVALLPGGILAIIGILAPVASIVRGEFLGLGGNYLHDLGHIGSGLAGLAAGYHAGGRYAARYDVAMDAIYALVVGLGFVAFEFTSELLASNTADNYVHLLLAVPFVAVGALAASRR